ncbi:hypothetical protein [Rhodopirellula sp. MGV]|uniref:hypothetical protein n=1 Tax=Rhodopirellula sp. MGV TaxID=2023130 RepID=UPI00117B5C4B|nr:hypothetical protein [Rhodopirellula sp. MGV]
MGHLLSKSNPIAIGVLFGRQHLYGCRLKDGVWGKAKTAAANVSLHQKDLSAAFSELLVGLEIESPSAVQVFAAIPTSECYFATRPVNSGGGNASPRTLLRESLRSTTAKLDQLSIDVLNWQADRRPLVSIVAVSNDRVGEISAAMQRCGVQLRCLRPAASVLICAADSARNDRSDRIATRIFLGENSVLGVMTKGVRPIHWQSIPLPPGDEARGIVSIVRSIEAGHRACGVEQPPETVLIYGRKELQSLNDQQWLAQNLPNGYSWFDTPSMQAPNIARSCIEGRRDNDPSEFNFIRQTEPATRLIKLIPYQEVFVYLAAVCLVAFVLVKRLGHHRSERREIAASLAVLDDKLSLNNNERVNPRQIRDQLNARASAVSQFLEKRIRWSPLLAEIASALPHGTRLTEVRGTAMMPQKRKREVRETPTKLVLNAECVLASDGQLPESVTELSDVIANLQSVRESFRSVEMTDIRRTHSQTTGVEGTQFSIVLTSDPTKG